MKKFLIALLLAIGTTTLFAQDIIITNDAKRIDAQILEISDYNVKYKLLSNPNGTVFSIETNKVASIVFANGDVYAPEIQQINIDLFPDTNETDVKEETIFEQPVYEPIPSVPVTLCTGKTIMFRSGLKLDPPYYGEYKLTNREQIDLMRQKCPDAYKMYRKGIPYLYWGIVVMFSGIGVLTYGLTIDQDKSLSNKLNAKLWTGLGGILASLGTTLMCIPITSIGMKPYSIFNEQCGNPNYRPNNDVSFSLMISPTNFGLTLTF